MLAKKSANDFYNLLSLVFFCSVSHFAYRPPFRRTRSCSIRKKKPIRNTLQQQQNWQSGNKNNTHRHREKEREREEERERDNGRAASRVRQAEFVAKVLQATEQVKYNNKQANALLYAARREYPVKSALLAFYFINFHRYLGHFSYKLFHY